MVEYRSVAKRGLQAWHEIAVFVPVGQVRSLSIRQRAPRAAEGPDSDKPAAATCSPKAVSTSPFILFV